MEMTLAQLKKGSTATVTAFAESDPEAVRKLLSLGLVPGDRLLVLARWPAVVFEVGASCLALDAELASRVFVSPADA